MSVIVCLICQHCSLTCLSFFVVVFLFVACISTYYALLLTANLFSCRIALVDVAGFASGFMGFHHSADSFSVFSVFCHWHQSSIPCRHFQDLCSFLTFSNTRLFQIPAVDTKSTGQRASACQGPTVWSQLPHNTSHTTPATQHQAYSLPRFFLNCFQN